MFNLKREKLSLSFCNLSNFHYLCRTNQYQAYETRITFKGIPSLLRWFQDDDPRQKPLDHHPYQTCDYLPRTQTFLLPRLHRQQSTQQGQG